MAVERPEEEAGRVGPADGRSRPEGPESRPKSPPKRTLEQSLAGLARAAELRVERAGEMDRPATAETLLRHCRKRFRMSRAAVERTVLGEMRGAKSLDWWIEANARFSLREMIGFVEESR